MNFLIRILKNELIRGSLWLLIGTIVSSFLAFLTNLFLARQLSITDYGIYASIISLLTLATIPSKSISTVIIKFAGSFFAKNQKSPAAKLYRRLTVLFLWISLLIVVGSFMFSFLIADFLHVDNNAYLFLLILAVALAYLSIVNQSYLASLLKFSYITYVNIVGSVLRLLTAILLIYSGFKLFGAIWSIVISYFAMFILRFLPLKFLLRLKPKNNISLPKHEMLKYSIPSTTALLALSSFVSTDIILARHFLSPHDAGLYGGLSLIGKVIMYITGPISSAMFPIIVRRYEMKEDFRKIFYLAVGFVALPSLVIALFYFVFPEFTILLFLSKVSYIEVAHLLWMFGVFATIYSILYIFLNFFLSIKRTNVVFGTVFFAISQIVLISFFHDDIFQVVGISILTSSLLLLTFLFYLITHSKNLH